MQMTTMFVCSNYRAGHHKAAVSAAPRRDLHQGQWDCSACSQPLCYVQQSAAAAAAAAVIMHVLNTTTAAARVGTVPPAVQHAPQQHPSITLTNGPALSSSHASLSLLLDLQKEASDVFFAATKLFQAKDPHLRRMVYLLIKVCVQHWQGLWGGVGVGYHAG